MALEAGCFDVDDRDRRAATRRKPSGDGRRDLSCPPPLHPSTWHPPTLAYRAIATWLSLLVLGQHPTIRASARLPSLRRGENDERLTSQDENTGGLNYRLNSTTTRRQLWSDLGKVLTVSARTSKLRPRLRLTPFAAVDLRR